MDFDDMIDDFKSQYGKYLYFSDNNGRSDDYRITLKEFPKFFYIASRDRYDDKLQTKEDIDKGIQELLNRSL